MKKYIIANWKMEKGHQESIDWLEKTKEELAELSQKENIVLCPAFTELDCVKKILSDKVLLGAQNCASEKSGALTGEVSPITLKELGCDFCIVGHSERRKNFGESNQIINKKIKLLIKEKISPIVCIGESKEEFEQNKTLEVLNKQLSESFLDIKSAKTKILIAYEPIWAIGTGIVPAEEDILKVFKFIDSWKKDHFVDTSCEIIYGGSVNETNIKSLNQIDLILGFLIGKASLDFQTLKKIVLSLIS